MLTIASHLDVMNRLGRAMADPTRSRILMTLLGGPSSPAVLSRELVDEAAPCIDPACSVSGCCGTAAGA